MPNAADRAEAPTAIHTSLAAIFVSLELSRSVWLITSLSPGSGEKMSKHSVPAGDVAARFCRKRFLAVDWDMIAGNDSSGTAR